MPNAWNSNDITLPAVEGTAVTTGTVISKDFRITAGGATLMRIDSYDLACTLETSSDGGTTWVAATKASVDKTTKFQLLITPADTGDVPLSNLGRIKAGANGTITKVFMIQED